MFSDIRLIHKIIHNTAPPPWRPSCSLVQKCFTEPYDLYPGGTAASHNVKLLSPDQRFLIKTNSTVRLKTGFWANSHASTEIETSVLRLPVVGTSGDGAALVGSLIPYRALPMSHILSNLCISLWVLMYLLSFIFYYWKLHVLYMNVWLHLLFEPHYALLWTFLMYIIVLTIICSIVHFLVVCPVSFYCN